MKIIYCWCDDACDADRHHRIGLTPRGRLVALDHSPGLRREAAFAELGGRLPHCHYLVKNLLRAHNRASSMPEPIRDAAALANLKREQRALAAHSNYRRPMTVPEKYTALTRLAVVAALQRCHTLVGDKPVWTYTLPRPGTYTLDVILHPWRQWWPITEILASIPTPETAWRLSLPTRWWLNVYKKGVAVLDGHLVVDAFWWPDHDRVSLSVLRQNRAGRYWAVAAAELPGSEVLAHPEKVCFYAPKWGAA